MLIKLDNFYNDKYIFMINIVKNYINFIKELRIIFDFRYDVIMCIFI